MKSSFFALLALLALAGCRRADIREVTIEIPGLAAVADDPAACEAARQKILDALVFLDERDGDGYAGVMTNKIEWGRTSLTIQFDSMQIAEMNLRKAIEKAGYAVTYPELKKGAPAGYINARKDEVRD